MAQELQYDTESTYGPNQPQAPVSGNKLADEATAVACKMLDDGVLSRQPRFNDIRKNEDMANGVNKPALRGRSNIPFDSVVLRGYLDALMSEVDEQIGVQFIHNREQDKLAADKQSACWDIEKGAANGALDEKILLMKRLAGVAGRGFIKMRMGNQPKFFTDWDVCDHYDMVTESQGGNNLDKHLYKFQMNIMASKERLLEEVANKNFDNLQVRKLVNRYLDASWFKNNDDIFNNKAVRYAAFGVDIKANNYVGQPLYRLTEGVINFRGKWYYIVFSREAKLWLEFKPLEEKFEWSTKYEGRGPWLTFATHPHPFLFWTVAPADDVRPFAYAMKKVVNLTIDNLEKRNWDMKAYNPRIFTEPNQLLWRQDGLVKANLKPGDNINNGIYQFQTPDTTNITINLTQFLDQFLGKQTGITPDNPNQKASDPRLYLQFSNVQQVSKRMTLQSKNYRKLYTDLAVMFDYGLYQYLREPYAVKLIGNEGVQWDEYVTREDVAKEFQVAVVSELDNDEKNATMLERRKEIFAEVLNNPNGFVSQYNKKWFAKELLKTAGYKDDVAKIATDTDIDSDGKLFAEAADSIQKIIDGEYAAINRNATPGFVQKIINFAQDHYSLISDTDLKTMSPGFQKSYTKKMTTFDALMKYAKSHTTPDQMNPDGTPGASIIEQNMQRRAMLVKMQQALTNPTPQQNPQNPQTPQQGVPTGQPPIQPVTA